MLASCWQTPRGRWLYPSAMTDRSRFTIIPIGSLHTEVFGPDVIEWDGLLLDGRLPLGAQPSSQP
jgi:hypothetical protein